MLITDTKSYIFIVDFLKGDNSQRQGDKREQRSGICVVLGSADSAQGSGSSQQETGTLLATCN